MRNEGEERKSIRLDGITSGRQRDGKVNKDVRGG